MSNKIIQLGNDYICLAWNNESKKERLVKWFSSVDKIAEWMVEHKGEYNQSSAKIKKSGLFSLKKGWRLVRHTTGEVLGSN